ncbi:hypothetical protein [Paenibacillus urinalis]|uniref:Uncharacterized protein n=1 Tax=Paenibacillus urinalis TaxID=521520 RepID=A0AAX3N1F0_9BACL|nr:hypothetical protein [Paenibacillus urinalis]WDH83676.1 hypothetical protein PUW23_05465 [Paenibacillus urinalis]
MRSRKFLPSGSASPDNFSLTPQGSQRREPSLPHLRLEGAACEKSGVCGSRTLISKGEAAK